MFQRNEALLTRYAAHHPQSQETLVDFGIVPAEAQDREDWNAEASRFLKVLARRGYQFHPAMYDGDSGLCPLYTVRLNKGDFRGPVPVDLSYFQWMVKRLCYPGQITTIRERVLEIHILGDEQLLEEIVPPR